MRSTSETRSQSALGQALRGKIDSIDQIVPLIWDAAATYEPGQTVVYNGKIWSWQGTDPGNEEPPGTNWQDVGDAIAEAGAVAGRVNTLELQVNDPETGLQAIGQKTDGLFVQLNVQAAGDEDWGAGDETVSPEP